MDIRRMRPSPAMVVATIALVISLGGVGYAAGLIGTNDIKDGAVTTPKLHADAVTSGKVAPHSLTRVDIDVPKLGKVPAAATADNALALGGEIPAAFERSTRVLFGAARADLGTPQFLFADPAVGVNLFTAGNASSNPQVQVTNTNSTGNLIGTPITSTGAHPGFAVSHGASQIVGPAVSTSGDYLDMLLNNTGVAGLSSSLWVHCLFNFDGGDLTAFCWGIRAVNPS
ncbi:MAG TPA: hypothetical protein VID47_03160 [Actinomycetota bacterium]|jgi:hypothetical protein